MKIVKDSHARSLIKGISWRTLGTIDTIILSFIVTGDVEHSFKIGLTEIVTKVMLYYLHERAWNSVVWGRIPGHGPSHVRSLTKGVSWRTIGTFDTILIAYLVTGVPVNAFAIGGFEVFTKIALFYVHERIWGQIWWGRLPKDSASIKSKKSCKVKPSLFATEQLGNK